MKRNKSITYYKNKADKLCSEIVRSKGFCEWCRRPKDKVQLQCAHIVGRNNHTLRFDLKNLLCLCAGCHRKGHDNPLEFITWVQREYSERVAYLESKKNVLAHRKLVDYQELVKELEAIKNRQDVF